MVDNIKLQFVKLQRKNKVILISYFKQIVYLCNVNKTFDEMGDVRIEKGINKNNALLLCKWSNEQGKEFRSNGWVPKFLTRWTMAKYRSWRMYFRYSTKFIEMIQEVRIDKDNIHIGRFVIDPRKTGLGFGTEALKDL